MFYVYQHIPIGFRNGLHFSYQLLAYLNNLTIIEKNTNLLNRDPCNPTEEYK